MSGGTSPVDHSRQSSLARSISSGSFSVPFRLPQVPRSETPSSIDEVNSDRAPSRLSGVTQQQQLLLPQPHAFVTNIAKELKLSQYALSDLHRLAGMGIQAGFANAELLFRLTEHANVLSLRTSIDHLIERGKNTDAVLAEVKEMFQAKWDMTDNQKDDLAGLVKDFLFDYKSTEYHNVGERIKIHVQEHAKDLHFSDCFTSRHRLKIFEKELHRQLRFNKNAYRNHIKILTFGDKRVGLDQYYIGMAKKFYSQGHLRIEDEHRTRMLLLRRFGRENPEALKYETPEGEEDQQQTESVDQGGSTSSGKKRQRTQSDTISKAKGRGRVPKGTDWWTCVDNWFEGRVKEWGADFTNPQWTEYIEESIQLEQDGGQSRDSLIRLPGYLGTARSAASRALNSSAVDSENPNISMSNQNDTNADTNLQMVQIAQQQLVQQQFVQQQIAQQQFAQLAQQQLAQQQLTQHHLVQQQFAQIAQQQYVQPQFAPQYTAAPLILMGNGSPPRVSAMGSPPGALGTAHSSGMDDRSSPSPPPAADLMIGGRSQEALSSPRNRGLAPTMSANAMLHQIPSTSLSSFNSVGNLLPNPHMSGHRGGSGGSGANRYDPVHNRGSQ